MRISDWSSDVCSSDLSIARIGDAGEPGGKIDDPAAVREQRQQRLGKKEDALEVDVDQPVELRLCGVGDQGIVAVSGIVDEVIKCIALPSLRERRTQPIHKGRKRRDVAGVQLDRKSTRLNSSH